MGSYVFLECGSECFDVFVEGALVGFVAFSKNNGPREVVVGKPFYEAEIDCLWWYAAVDEYTNLRNWWSMEEIVGNHIFPVETCFLGDLGVSISRKIYEIPVFFVFCIIFTSKWKIIDQLGFSWRNTYFRKTFFVAQHVDKRWFANITSSNEHKFWTICWRACLSFWCGSKESSWGDVHNIYSGRINHVYWNLWSMQT